MKIGAANTPLWAHGHLEQGKTFEFYIFAKDKGSVRHVRPRGNLNRATQAWVPGHVWRNAWGAWCAAAQGVSKSQTQLSNWTMMWVYWRRSRARLLQSHGWQLEYDLFMVLAVWSWLSYWTSVSLSLLICKMGMMIILACRDALRVKWWFSHSVVSNSLWPHGQ